MITLYGIPDCDTVKKATIWLKKNKTAFTFHDYKKEGISKKKLEEWCRLQPIALLFNKRSTAWKELTAAEQERSTTKTGAITLMQQYNNLIKRPVLEISGTILIGFNETDYKKNIP